MRLSARTLWRASVALSLPAILAAPAAAQQAKENEYVHKHGWLLPTSITEYGDDVDKLWWFIFVITAITFLLTEGALLWFMWKYRARPGTKAFYTHGSHKVEVVWTIIPSILLAIIAFVQMPDWLKAKDPSRMPFDDPAAFKVHVLARQFNWNFRYAGPDGQMFTKDDYSLTTLTVPANRPICLSMRSIDVIHSLFLPHCRFKQDIVPGLTMNAWFQIKAEEHGHWPVVCAELCGYQHYTMKSDMFVIEESKWAAEEKRLSDEAMATGGIDYTSGQEIFRFWPSEEGQPEKK